MPGTLFVVATPIGNLEDITGRALRVLRSVAVIAAEDTRRTAHLLARYAITTPTTSLHEHNEVRKVPSLVSRLELGHDVAVVSDAGTPTISDPGARLVKAAVDAGIRVESVPGPNAIIAALAVSGLLSDSFTFLGFPPTRSKARSDWFNRLKGLGGTAVFFEAPHRIRKTLAELERIIGDCPIVVCREMTKAHEEVLRGPISKVKDLILARGEFTVVINIGHSPDFGLDEPVAEEDMLAEFGDMTKSGGLNRRAAVTAIASRHGLKPNQVYRLIEQAKKSGK